MGAGEILLTSMDCDGTKAGYDNELTALVAANVSVPVYCLRRRRHKGAFFTMPLQLAVQMQLWRLLCFTTRSWRFGS